VAHVGAHCHAIRQADDRVVRVTLEHSELSRRQYDRDEVVGRDAGICRGVSTRVHLRDVYADHDRIVANLLAIEHVDSVVLGIVVAIGVGVDVASDTDSDGENCQAHYGGEPNLDLNTILDEVNQARLKLFQHGKPSLESNVKHAKPETVVTGFFTKIYGNACSQLIYTL